ncbi:MAG: FHA domain-containing protein [Bacteroidota bacterium]
MTKEEALAFLELTDTSTAAEIKARLAERLNQYEMLSEKAPSDFLRRLNLRKLDKIKIILQESAQWPLFVAEHLTVPQEEIHAVVEEPAQTVYIVSSLKDSVLKKAETASLRTRSADEPAGWLILHMENRPAKTYPLQTGKNFIGRKQPASLSPFIVIEGDEFISRVQCVLYAEEDKLLQFYVSDPAAYNNGKTSKNGTYINGQKNAITQKIPLADGDTVQVGVTKLVLRYNTAAIGQLVKEVEQSLYIDTVVLAN